MTYAVVGKFAKQKGLTLARDERKQDAGDWQEDLEHENGDYQNRCIECGDTFFGHKRRMICKKCSPPSNAELSRVAAGEKHDD